MTPCDTSLSCESGRDCEKPGSAIMGGDWKGVDAYKVATVAVTIVGPFPRVTLLIGGIVVVGVPDDVLTPGKPTTEQGGTDRSGRLADGFEPIIAGENEQVKRIIETQDGNTVFIYCSTGVDPCVAHMTGEQFNDAAAIDFQLDSSSTLKIKVSGTWTNILRKGIYWDLYRLIAISCGTLWMRKTSSSNPNQPLKNFST
eukprot:GHVN01094322.1.p1 GENE.GHVN01094322.1~~GHVN01094322.1.p1  ORF type:complete len:199 (+),score=22.22 GHVN01094322.1:575-1171(+)